MEQINQILASKSAGMRVNTVIYDADCGFCDFWKRFVQNRGGKRTFQWLALSSVKADNEFSKSIRAAAIHSVVVIHNRRMLEKTDAVLAIVKNMSWPWRWIYVLRILPKAFRDGVYIWVANRRCRFSSSRRACRLTNFSQTNDIVS